LSNSRKTPRLAAAIAVAVCMVMAFAALGGVGLAQTSGGPGGKQYDKKVTICHKGKKTISISKSALPAHQRHGDAVGTCAAVAKAKKAKAAKAAKAKAAAAKAKAEKAKAEKAEQSKGGGKGKGK
jgi:microcystin-dependent protein